MNEMIIGLSDWCECKVLTKMPQGYSIQKRSSEIASWPEPSSEDESPPIFTTISLYEIFVGIIYSTQVVVVCLAEPEGMCIHFTSSKLLPDPNMEGWLSFCISSQYTNKTIFLVCMWRPCDPIAGLSSKATVYFNPPVCIFMSQPPRWNEFSPETKCTVIRVLPIINPPITYRNSNKNIFYFEYKALQFERDYFIFIWMCVGDLYESSRFS